MNWALILLSTAIIAQVPHGNMGGDGAVCPVTGKRLGTSESMDAHGTQVSSGTPQKNAEEQVRPGGKNNREWWPNQLDLSVLRQHSALSDPMSAGFNYREAFRSLDYYAVKKDIEALMTSSQDWWPADWELWWSLHPHGVAQRRHLPYGRWKRRLEGRATALRSDQLLA